jgi:hypothetical protein
MDALCYRCGALAERTCERCNRGICRGCAQVWPMYDQAIKMRLATCRDCHRLYVRRTLEEVRRWLSAQGIEPHF